MDIELTLWIVFFVGGYMAVLAYLLRTALWNRSRRGDAPPPG